MISKSALSAVRSGTPWTFAVAAMARSIARKWSSASDATLIAASTFSGAMVEIRTEVSSRTRFNGTGQ